MALQRSGRPISGIKPASLVKAPITKDHDDACTEPNDGESCEADPHADAGAAGASDDSEHDREDQHDPKGKRHERC